MFLVLTMTRIYIKLIDNITFFFVITSCTSRCTVIWIMLLYGTTVLDIGNDN